MSKVVCPYCFEQFERNEVEFRCSNMGRCKQENDPVLERFWNDLQITGIPIKPSGFLFGLKMGIPQSARCPECGQKSFLMIFQEKEIFSIYD